MLEFGKDALSPERADVTARYAALAPFGLAPAPRMLPPGDRCAMVAALLSELLPLGGTRTLFALLCYQSMTCIA